ncbi:MAG: AbfB domain-containing protein [Chitinophagales bacterium]
MNSADNIYLRDSDRWRQVSGKLKQISVGSNKHIWGVNSADKIYRWGDGQPVPKPAPAPTPAISTSLSTMLTAENPYSFESLSNPKYYIRYENFTGKITKDASLPSNKAGSFKMVQGLAGDNTMSFESIEYPGYFLRNQKSQITLQQATPDELFKKDASFKVVKGLGNSTMVSFESYNYPMHFICNDNFNLVIAKPEGDIEAFKKEATFRPTRALFGFQSPTNPTNRGRGRN